MALADMFGGSTITAAPREAVTPFVRAAREAMYSREQVAARAARTDLAVQFSRDPFGDAASHARILARADRNIAIADRQAIGRDADFSGGYVYCVHVQGETCPVKIGKADDVERRVRELRGQSLTVYVAAHSEWFPNPYAAEHGLHDLYAEWRISCDGSRTEWFNVPVYHAVRKLKAMAAEAGTRDHPNYPRN